MIQPSIFIDYTVLIRGEETRIRIFEKPAILFIYINQKTEEMRRYDAALESILSRSKVRSRCKLLIFCNLMMEEMVKDVGELVVKILNKRKLN